MTGPEMDLIVDEEFTSDYKEQYDTREDISKRLIEVKPCRDLSGTSVHEHYNKARCDHRERIELCHPRYKNRGKPPPVRDRR